MTGLHNGALCAIITHTGNPIWRLQTGNTNRFHEQRIETSVSSVLSQLETKFQRLPLCFRGPAMQWCYCEYCTVDYGKLFGLLIERKLPPVVIRLLLCVYVNC